MGSAAQRAKETIGFSEKSAVAQARLFRGGLCFRQRAAQAEDIWEAVFPTLMMGDDRAIAGVWINGSPVG